LPHSLPLLSLHALRVDVVREGQPGRVRVADLDRAARVEGGDLLARDHLLARADLRSQPLVYVDDVPGLGAVEEPVEDALARRACATVRPAGSAHLQDAGVADR